MYLYQESKAMLNDQASTINGSDASFKIHYWGVDPHLKSNPVHKHSFFEICYVMDGEGNYTDEGVNYPLAKGTHFCSRPGIIHQIRTETGLSLLFVAFELDESQSKDAMKEAFRLLAEDGEVIVKNGGHFPTACIWKSLLFQEESGDLPLSAIPSLAYALLLSFLTLFGKRELRPVISKQRSNLILRQAKLYIRDNLSQRLSLQDVSRYLNVSYRHLSRLFSEGINESFTNFIRYERIRLASHLLKTSELSIKEIAEITGFSSVHYFSKTFKEAKKIPPGQFREAEANH